MQTEFISLHFMEFIKGGPATGGGGKKKEGKEEKDRDRGHKNTHKILPAELRKFAEVTKKLSKNAQN